MAAQLATLDGIFIAICGMFYPLLGHVASRILGAQPGLAKATTKVAGVAMILVGIGLLSERALLLLGR